MFCHDLHCVRSSALGELVDPAASGRDVERSSVSEQDAGGAIFVDQIDDKSDVAPRIIAEEVLLREARSDRPTRKATSNEVADNENAWRNDDSRSGRVPTDDPILALEAELIEGYAVGNVDTRCERRESRVDEALDESSPRPGRDQFGVVSALGDQPVGSTEYHWYIRRDEGCCATGVIRVPVSEKHGTEVAGSDALTSEALGEHGLCVRRTGVDQHRSSPNEHMGIGDLELPGEGARVSNLIHRDPCVYVSRVDVSAWCPCCVSAG